jgi:hypothetical protein
MPKIVWLTGYSGKEIYCFLIIEPEKCDKCGKAKEMVYYNFGIDYYIQCF